ncbi:MAG: EAL domain-containing protein [Alphaproteobacteria bacterium]
MHEGEQRFRDFADAAADWLWETDEAHRFTFLAGAGSEAAGLEPERILGRTRWEFAGADPNHDDAWRRHKADLDGHRPFRGFRYSCVTARGSRLHFLVSGKPVFDSAGAFRGYRGAVANETGVVEALRRAAEAEALLRDAIESVSETFVIYDREDRFVMCNTAHRELYPELAEFLVPGVRFEDIMRNGLRLGLYPEARGREAEWLAERLRQHADPKGLIEQRLRNGAYVAISERRMSNGGIAGLRMDLTAIKQAEDARREQEEQLLSIADNLPGAIFRRVLKTDGSLAYRYVSPRMRDVYAIEPEEIVSDQGFSRYIHPLDHETFKKALERSARELSPMVVELRLVLPDGRTRWMRSSSRPRKLANGDIQWDGLVLDITELKDAEGHRDRLAYFDQLTDLPNQSLFADRLAQAITLAGRSGESVAVVCLELISLKDVRDSQGMMAGDDAVREAGRRIQMALRAGDTVAYAGGGQFFALLTSLRMREDASVPVRKLAAAVEESYTVGGSEVPLKASLGISLWPGDGEAGETLVRNATTALNMAKANPGQPYQFYDIQMTESAVARLNLEAELRHAIEKEEFVLLYQPVVDARNFHIISAEASLWWRHGARGLLPPEEFMPVAEESGLIIPLGELVLRTACAQARAWRDADWQDALVSVNLSGAQLLDAGFGDSVLANLARSGLAPRHLKLELTERTFSRKIEAVTRTIERLARAGIQFAVDDFGLEYAVLSHLARLPIDTLKIARPFIERMTTDQAHGAMVQAVISMAQAIGKSVVAEGVETREQLTYLQAFQCNALQGPLFSKPVTAEELVPLLREGALKPPPPAMQLPAEP